MATYRKNNLSKHKGRYRRAIGKSLDGAGSLKPQRFGLGTDEREAELAVRRLEKLWSEIEADFKRRELMAIVERQAGTSQIQIDPVTGELIEHPVSVLDTGPIWESHTLAMAHAIRKGQHEILVHPAPRYPPTIIIPVKYPYAARIMELRERYTAISFMPSDPVLFAQQVQVMSGCLNTRLSKAELASQRAEKLANAAVQTKSGKTLYQAIRAYSAYAKQSGRGGPNEPKDVLSLKRALRDMPLVDFDFDQILAIGDYFRSRPATQRYGGKGKRIAVDTVVDRLKTSSRFIRWLASASAWDWKPPAEWGQALKVNKHKIRTERERLDLAAGADHWTDEELTTLYSYATDRERLIMLLGLNLGYSHSETRELRPADVAAAGE